MRAIRACAAGLVSLCLLLSACGGGDREITPPAELPSAVSIAGATTVEAGEPAQFMSDIDAADDRLTFAWDFGDGGTSQEPSPRHQFRSPGEYEVTLAVSNEAGDSRTASLKVTVGHYAMVRDLVCSGPDQKGWCWQRPRPMGNTIEDIAFVDATTGWAVGGAGQILKTEDGGATWSAQVSHVTDRLTQVRFASATVGWVAGDNGALLRTSDAGVTWTRQTSGMGQPWGTFYAGLVVLDEQRAVVTPGYWGSRSTADGGQTWIDGVVTPHQVTADGTLWEMDFDRLLKSVNLGADGTTVSFDGSMAGQYLRRFTMGSERHGLLMVYDWNTSTELMRRTSDGGSSWVPIAATGLPGDVSYLKLFGANVAWAVASGGMYRSTDGASSWTPVTHPGGVSYWQLDALSAQDAQTAWFPHENGYYMTSDAGAHWTWLHVGQELFSPTSLSRSAGGLWLRYSERTYRSTDGGTTWTQVFGSAPDESAAGLSAVWFFDSKKGLAVGTGGWMFETADGGRQWARKSLTGQPGYLNSRLQFQSSSLGWMSGAWGVSKTTDGGASWWSPLTSAGFAYVEDFHFIDAKIGWAISNRQDLYRTTDGGDSWTLQTSLPSSSLGVHFADEKMGIVVGYGGAIRRTSDGGVTWILRPTDVFADLHRVAFSDASTGWAVGESGAVVMSADGGLTWSRVPVPTTASLRDVTFVDPMHGWIVGDGGTVLATEDGGKTWRVQASGSSLGVQSAFFLDAYTGWLVGEGSAVLATATGGR